VDPGSTAFKLLEPGSGFGIRDEKKSGSKRTDNSYHISRSLETIFWVKNNSVLRIRDEKIQPRDPGWKNPDTGSEMEKSKSGTVLLLLLFKVISFCNWYSVLGTVPYDTVLIHN
jgi:hypothetical protein